MRKLLAVTVAFAFAFSAGSFAEAAPAKPAAAKPAASKPAQCRDDKGKFIKCTAPAAPTGKCRDKTTKKFAKCDAPNTEPVPPAKK